MTSDERYIFIKMYMEEMENVKRNRENTGTSPK